MERIKEFRELYYKFLWTEKDNDITNVYINFGISEQAIENEDYIAHIKLDLINKNVEEFSGCNCKIFAHLLGFDLDNLFESIYEAFEISENIPYQ